MKTIFRFLLSALFLFQICGSAPDLPFDQPVSIKYPLPQELRGTAEKICIDQDGIVYVLTASGVARLFGEKVALDNSYRPLAGKVPRDITVSDGRLYYLFGDEVLSNRRAGKFVRRLGKKYNRLAVNGDEAVVLVNGGGMSLLKDGEMTRLGDGAWINRVVADRSRFIALGTEKVISLQGTKVGNMAKGHHFTAAAFGLGGVVLGTTNGFLVVHPEKGEVVLPLQTKLPSRNITALAVNGEDLWAGTTRGVWWRNSAGGFRYFASKRWLDDDAVIDLAIANNGDVYALTKTGLNKIAHQKMTLEDKARHYDKKIRQRHIRYGFCAELRLKVPGDITSAEMIDTDNDGTWSNYYMASQAFRYGATGEEEARRNAWETFEALERLESINPLEGFPSRTFERKGFKVSDPERWHTAEGDVWDWKAHTSSDEIIAHVFGSSVLYELVAETASEKQRIAHFISKVADHIIKNNWQLIDVDGKPTLWARWNPEYVNGFPETVVDRRLNSAEIIGLLQFAHKITGREIYKEKAYELFEKHGYLKNILSPMSKIAYTAGVLHEGIEMGNEWNHSDDLLAFDSYWVLYHYAFDDALRDQYAVAIKEHWEMERAERCPLWNFIYGSTGIEEFGLEKALWTLRFFPLDMIDWSVSNSERGDITRKEPNFRNQQLEALLPPDERRITRWNSQPFILDGGSGGRIELAGDEFLLPYWMGRHLKMILPPASDLPE